MSDVLKRFVELYEENGKDWEMDGVTVVERGEWEQDYKLQLRTTVVLFDGHYIGINESRSGSPFTDWHYDDAELFLCEKKEETRVVVSYPAIADVESVTVAGDW